MHVIADILTVKTELKRFDSINSLKSRIKVFVLSGIVK